MKDQSKTKQVLIQELASMKERIEELEQSESGHKRLEETLRESEGRYRRIAENMSDVVSEVDAQGIIRYTSPSYKRVFGDIQHEVIGRSAFDSIHPEDQDRVAAEYMEGVRTKTVREVEYRVRHSDGHYIWLHSFGHSFFGAAGELLGMIVTSRDISERKQAEEALRESETRFKALFEKSLDAQILMDHEGKVIDCNDAFVELFCLRGKSEVIGHRPSDFAPELQLNGTPSSEMGNKIRTAILEKGSAKFEWSHQKHDLTRTPILTELSCTLIQIANCPMIHVVIRDITARKQVEEALQESEKKYRLIAENTADLISVLDMNLRFTYVSPASMRIRGFTVEEAMEQTLEQVLTPESMQLGLSVFEKEMQLEASGTADPDRTRILELEEYKKDGSTILVEVNLSFLRDNDRKPVAILIVSRDISERKQAEEALRDSEQRFRGVLENLEKVAVQGYEPDGTITFWNRGSELTYGFSSLAALGRNIIDLIHGPETREAEQRLMDEALRTGNFPPAVELEVINKDGQKVTIYTSRILAPRPGGQLEFFCFDVDITERKRAEEALRQSDKRIRLFFERQLVGMAITSPEKGWLQVNKRLSEMLGYSPEELSLLTWAELTYPDDLAADVAQFNRLLSGDIDQYFLEKRFIRKDGAVINTNLSIGCVRRQDGSVDYVLALLEDITEQKRAEEALHESEERYRSIFETTLEGIYQTTPQGRYLRVNPAFALMLGYDSPEDLIESITDIGIQVYVNPDRRSEFRRHLSEHDRVDNFEAQLCRKDGTTMWGLINAVTVRNENGDILYYTGGMMDITDRKRAEEAQRKSEEILRLITDNMSDMIRVTDLQGVNLFTSPSHFKGLGYSPEERVGKSAFDIIHPDDLERVINIFSEGLAANRPVSLEYRVRHADGHYVWLETVGDLLRDAQGKTTAVVMSSRDITDRKQVEEEKRSLEERLKRSEKMEALGQLAGGVAHDLNNVLGVLSGYSELLLLETPKGHRSRGHAEKILQSTEKGAAIIDDLLTLARRGVVVSDVISLNSLVSDFIKTPVFESMKDYHPRVTFRTEYDKNLLNIKGSPVHLEKTLMNLVSNAAESISGEGEVTIRTESRYLDKSLRGYDEVKDGDYAILTVSDTGMGILAENREKIFEPFYTKKTMGRSGTGLGLAIVWGTVKDHNGYIDVQTEVGKGTTFTLYFPVTREELIAQQQKETIERYMGKGESVLVVDDIAEQRDIAARLLTKLGYNVRVVSSGEEAVEYLKGNKADILLLDMIMTPGIDGLETYQRALGINPKQKAIIVSGFSETDRVKEAQKLGAGAYIKKPYVMEKIGSAIRDELDRK